uniref:Uncharacterized protein n=1 Tax=Cacopsylla melanoneura TaxID=428564 RepID=A0A8D8UQQ1_9HEMI
MTSSEAGIRRRGATHVDLPQIMLDSLETYSYLHLIQHLPTKTSLLYDTPGHRKHTTGTTGELQRIAPLWFWRETHHRAYCSVLHPYWFRRDDMISLVCYVG